MPVRSVEIFVQQPTGKRAIHAAFCVWSDRDSELLHTRQYSFARPRSFVLAPVLSGVSRLLPHAAYQRTGVLDLLCIVASSLQRSLAGIPALR